MAVCSGVGVCDTSKGECVCPAPFEGGACERLACPGGTSPCSNNGRCLTMAQLALHAKVNGDPISITYGATPNNPKTWDFNKIQGCICDPGFTSYDCSKRSCPHGDDPHTVGQSHEVQAIVCQHTQVTSFQLSFRGALTTNLASTIAAGDLQTALQAVKTIGTVQVTYSSGTSACTLTGTNKISIQFLSPLTLGDIPSIRLVAGANAALLPVFQIDCDGVGTSVQGTVEDAECSNKYVRMSGSGVPTELTWYYAASQWGLRLRHWYLHLQRRYDQQRRLQSRGCAGRLRLHPAGGRPAGQRSAYPCLRGTNRELSGCTWRPDPGWLVILYCFCFIAACSMFVHCYYSVLYTSSNGLLHT